MSTKPEFDVHEWRLTVAQELVSGLHHPGLKLHQFRLKSLLVAVVIFSVGCALYRAWLRPELDHRWAVQHINDNVGYVYHDYQVHFCEDGWTLIDDARSPRLLKLFSDDPVVIADIGEHSVSDTDIVALQALDGLQIVYLWGPQDDPRFDILQDALPGCEIDSFY